MQPLQKEPHGLLELQSEQEETLDRALRSSFRGGVQGRCGMGWGPSPQVKQHCGGRCRIYVCKRIHIYICTDTYTYICMQMRTATPCEQGFTTCSCEHARLYDLLGQGFMTCSWSKALRLAKRTVQRGGGLAAKKKRTTLMLVMPHRNDLLLISSVLHSCRMSIMLQASYHKLCNCS